MKFNFRAIWYAVVVWMFVFFTTGVVIVPWFYAIVPLLVLMFTVYYFDGKKVGVNNGDDFISDGLWIGIFWFLFASVFSLLEIIGFYYFNFAFYFSDFKNVYLFPVLLIVPVMYGIVLSNTKGKKRVKRNKRLHLKSRAVFHF